MSFKADILSRFSGEGGQGCLCLPNLTLWYNHHRGKDSLPTRWKDHSLAQIARDLGLPVWLVTRPWKIETPGVEIRKVEEGGERSTHLETSAGALTDRWSLGPDATWWQTEYPVKGVEDLEVVLELVQARSYVLDSGELEELEAMAGDDGIVAIEVPSRPYSGLLPNFCAKFGGYKT